MRIESYMKKYKVTQKQLGTILHINQAAINHKLKGRRKWSSLQALEIEKYTKGLVSRMDVLYPNNR